MASIAVLYLALDKTALDGNEPGVADSLSQDDSNAECVPERYIHLRNDCNHPCRLIAHSLD
jgi:hypothetical protein